MEFIDHTGHIFSLPSYSEYPVGYEYDTNDYIFWLENEYTGHLSIDNYYIKAIRPILQNIADPNAEQDECCYEYIVGGEDSEGYEETVITELPYLNEPIVNKFEHKLMPPSSSFRGIKDIHISVDSKYYKLIASSQIQNLISSNKSISDYINIDESDITNVLKKDDISFVYNLEDDDKNFTLCPFYVIGNTDNEGTWMTNVMIHVEYDDGEEEWCPITVGGEYIDESEPLYINGRNMGIDLPKDILRAVYQSSFYNDIPNLSLYNEKIKELLLTYNHIKMGAGNFMSAIDSLKWFGWGKHLSISKLIETDNQFLQQYIRDYFDISNDMLYSFRTFRATTLVALYLAENAETDEIDKQDFNKEYFIGEGKPIMEDLFHKVIEKKYDEQDISFYRPYYDYIFDEIGLKITALKYYYEKYFLPIHLSIHSASIQHRVFANDIKFTQKTEVKTAQPPILNADPNITVKFPGENVRYIYNHKIYTDENYNVFSNTYDYAANTEMMAYYINDVCVDIPIAFMSTVNRQHYNCVLLLIKEGKQIYESHFNFIQQINVGLSDMPFTIDNEFKQFIIVPKMFDENFNINYWINKDYEIKLCVNGNWYSYKFKIKLPEFQLNFGKLIYKYNAVTDFTGKREITEGEWGYIGPTNPDWYEGVNVRYDKLKDYVNYFRQINSITDAGIDFNSFMYVPSLVEVNDINFVRNLDMRIKWTNEELQHEINKWHVNQIQLSDIKFPLKDENDIYTFNDIVNGYYRLSVEETSTIKELTVNYDAFLDWHTYLKYLDIIIKLNPDNDKYAENLDSIKTEYDIDPAINDVNYIIDKVREKLSVIYKCKTKYDFVNNTIEYEYPEWSKQMIKDWEDREKDIENNTSHWEGASELYNWNYMHYYKPIIDEDYEEVIEDMDKMKKLMTNINYLEKIENNENVSYIHHTFIRFVGTNAVYDYIRSNDTIGMFDLPLTDDIGRKVIANGYLGLAVTIEGEFENGYTFNKIKYAEPPIRDIDNEEEGDYCPFSELCNDMCGNNCKYRRPVLSDRPKDDEGHYILTDLFNRKIKRLEKLGKANENQMYSDLILKNIGSLIGKYKENPIIVDNNKYLNRIHMYHLYDESGEMIKYEDNSKYPDIVRGEDNYDKLNTIYMNTKEGEPFNPNKEYFFQALYKQPASMIKLYREFFKDDGEAKLVYPKTNYFDFDTYLMHDDKYWYIVFISIMTINNIISEKDLIAQKTINYESYQKVNDKYILSTHNHYLDPSTNYVQYYDENDNENPYKDIEETITVNGVEYNAKIKQQYTVKNIYFIVNNTTKKYIEETDTLTKERYGEPVELINGNLHTWAIYFNNILGTDSKRLVALYDTKEEAESYICKLKFDLESEAQSYIDNLVEKESLCFEIVSEQNTNTFKTDWYIYKHEYAEKDKYGNITYSGKSVCLTDEPFNSEESVNKFLETEIIALKGNYKIIDESQQLYEYIYYNASTGTPIFSNITYKIPVYANYYGMPLTNKYTLKWQRSANQFLINRMFFVGAEGINQFEKDDIIVATIDNVNFPYIFENGSKWKFSPMSLGMSNTSIVKSNTNSALISIGHGNSVYNQGYYNVDVRYSVDSFIQHQYQRNGRILIKKQ